MSKSILVIDTPENCEKCRFSGSDGDVCCLEDKLISEKEYFDKKADWCPIRDLPRRKIFLGLDEQVMQWKYGKEVGKRDLMLALTKF